MELKSPGGSVLRILLINKARTMCVRLALTLLSTLCLCIFGTLCTAQSASPADTVYLITPYANFDTSSGLVDDFIIHDPAVNWPAKKERIRKQAREKRANVAMIRFTGNAYRGYIARVSLFANNDSLSLSQMLEQAGCYLVIFRDHGPSLAVYRYDVTINDVTYQNFRDLSFIKKQLDSCHTQVLVKINRTALVIPMEGRSRYFRLIKGGKGGAPGNGPHIRFGAYVLQEIEDAQLGHLLSEAHRQHLIAPR